MLEPKEKKEKNTQMFCAIIGMAALRLVFYTKTNRFARELENNVFCEDCFISLKLTCPCSD